MLIEFVEWFARSSRLFIEVPKGLAMNFAAVLAGDQVEEGGGLVAGEKLDAPPRVVMPPAMLQEAKPCVLVSVHELRQTTSDEHVSMPIEPSVPVPLRLAVTAEAHAGNPPALVGVADLVGRAAPPLIR